MARVKCWRCTNQEAGGWWWSYRLEDCKASDRSLWLRFQDTQVWNQWIYIRWQQYSNIGELDNSWYLERDLGTMSIRVLRQNLLTDLILTESQEISSHVSGNQHRAHSGSQCKKIADNREILKLNINISQVCRNKHCHIYSCDWVHTCSYSVEMVQKRRLLAEPG